MLDAYNPQPLVYIAYSELLIKKRIVHLLTKFSMAIDRATVQVSKLCQNWAIVTKFDWVT